MRALKKLPGVWYVQFWLQFCAQFASASIHPICTPAVYTSCVAMLAMHSFPWQPRGQPCNIQVACTCLSRPEEFTAKPAEPLTGAALERLTSQQSCCVTSCSCHAYLLQCRFAPSQMACITRSQGVLFDAQPRARPRRASMTKAAAARPQMTGCRPSSVSTTGGWSNSRPTRHRPTRNEPSPAP